MVLSTFSSARPVLVLSAVHKAAECKKSKCCFITPEAEGRFDALFLLLLTRAECN